MQIGDKYVPIKRNTEYSVYKIVDIKDNLVLVDEIMYIWGGGYYMRYNKIPFRDWMEIEDLLKYHRKATR